MLLRISKMKNKRVHRIYRHGMRGRWGNGDNSYKMCGSVKNTPTGGIGLLVRRRAKKGFAVWLHFGMEKIWSEEKARFKMYETLTPITSISYYTNQL